MQARLESVTFNDVETLRLTYHDNGNIKTKSDVKAGKDYRYGAKEDSCSVTPAAHALTSIDTLSYCYDESGNQISARDGSSVVRSITYAAFDKPYSITSSESITRFWYDAGFSRFKRRDEDTLGNRTTYYLGSVERVEFDNGGWKRNAISVLWHCKSLKTALI